ncbi:MAG: Stp1/IreP family PP2C-type Ser/Thr phosphatase [Clostridia bacterium]|nr:Stp1/IreP family PP2C-type Ser/Thr phosphatase [Clostridia bacterium]
MKHKFRFTKDTMKRLTDFICRREPEEKEEQKEEAEPVKPGLQVYALTDVGKVRAINQDALVVDEALMLYGVADGMGGHKGGETASAGARDGLIAGLQGKEPSLDALRDAITAANAALFQQQAGDESLSGMGTTLSVIWMSEHFVYFGHVGDSRVYRFREGKLEQMTDDHSLVGELVRAGYLTSEQAENHPNKNVILRAVGTEEGIDIDLAVEERKHGDLWLICSDGLHGMVKDSQMEAILSVNTPEAAAKLLMDAALAAGGRDNISVVLVQDGEVAR